MDKLSYIENNDEKITFPPYRFIQSHFELYSSLDIKNYCQDYLSCSFSIGLGVPNLPWVSLQLEGPVAFSSAKFENLAVISDKCQSFARITGGATKVAPLDTHLFI